MEASKSLTALLDLTSNATCNPYIDQTECVVVAKIHAAPKCTLIPYSTTQTVDLDVELKIQQRKKKKKKK